MAMVQMVQADERIMIYLNKLNLFYPGQSVLKRGDLGKCPIDNNDSISGKEVMVDKSNEGKGWEAIGSNVICPKHGVIVSRQYGNITVSQDLANIAWGVIAPLPIKIFTPMERDIKLVAEYLDKYKQCPIDKEPVNFSPSALGGEYICNKHGIIVITTYQPWRGDASPYINPEVGEAILGYKPTSILSEIATSPSSGDLLVALNNKTDRLINDIINKLSITKQCPICNNSLEIKKIPGTMAQTIITCLTHGIIAQSTDYRPGFINKQILDMVDSILRVTQTQSLADKLDEVLNPRMVTPPVPPPVPPPLPPVVKTEIQDNTMLYIGIGIAGILLAMFISRR